MTTAFLSESMRARGHRVIEGAAAPITGGSADSRLTQPGDLFAAFRGERLDGNDFVDEALARGAPAAVCERPPRGDWPDRTLALVGDTRTAMAVLARDWRRSCGVRVAGITGTVGKTTAKELTAAALDTHFRTHHSPGNLNSREGLPLALMSLQRDHEVSVLEMAMDSEGEIAELCGIAEPSVGAVLNIGATHLEKLGSMEAIEREKLSLARNLPGDGVAVLNVDDERIAPVVEELACEVIGFGASEAAGLRRGRFATTGWTAPSSASPTRGRRRTCGSSFRGRTSRRGRWRRSASNWRWEWGWRKRRKRSAARTSTGACRYGEAPQERKSSTTPTTPVLPPWRAR